MGYNRDYNNRYNATHRNERYAWVLKWRRNNPIKVKEYNQRYQEYKRAIRYLSKIDLSLFI
jgi:hypothetical protein